MLMLFLAAAALDAGPVSSEPAVVEPATVKVDQGIGPVVTVELVGELQRSPQSSSKRRSSMRKENAQALIIRLDTPEGFCRRRERS